MATASFKANQRLGRRGQIVSYDIYLAVFVFLILFGAMYLLWQGNLKHLDRERRILEMKYTAVQVADYLVSSPGNPVDWEVNLDPTAVGLASERLLLSESKVAKLPGLYEDGVQKLDYAMAKNYLNIANYDFYLKIESGSSLLFESGKANDSGLFIVSEYPLKEARIAYSRMVQYDNQPALLTLTIYG
ncbi:MAG TPA: hypothetical protein HA252_05720 [Candidatus Diapherotrites archaeon]|uniref:Uncharacterized protein n=1 Tax=Candidatus Iainarchaeum sp. TaxID=3101447 RepID=A0A7J4JKM7_9ARCH|nr:hypothetical protein [Candidatus Diapherotrites archaeon]HIH16875.1 hypothetical protein [Candidatus Diapherotrites archaeon]